MSDVKFKYSKPYFSLLVIIFILVLMVSITPASGLQGEVWNRTFDGEGMQDEGFDVIATSDGGYLITGYVTTVVGGEDLVLIKTDNAGQEIWRKSYGGTAYDQGVKVLSTGDGYVIAGSTQSFQPDSNMDAWLIMTDETGNELWNRTYGGDGWEEIYSLDNAGDGGFILAGYSSSFTDNHVSYLWLLKTDNNGQELWNNTFQTIYTSVGNEVIRTSDGGYAIGGTMSGNSVALLVKTNSTGGKEWERWYELGYTAGVTRRCNSLRQTTDGGYILAGTMGDVETSSLEGLLIKTDSEGNEQWHTTYGTHGSGANDEVNSVLVNNEGYVFGGYTTYPDTAKDFWLVQTDFSGVQLWNASFGGTSDDVAYALQEPSPGEYVLLGTTGGGTGYTDIWLVKAESSLPLDADFIGYPTSGTAPLTVTFVDTSTGNPTDWFWDFNDGTNSTLQNPVHTFQFHSNFSILLTVGNSLGYNTEYKIGYIQVAPAALPIADFIGNPREGNAPLGVQFSDSSTGYTTSWLWNFFDGTNSSEQNPFHTFFNPGNYSVLLVAGNPGGTNFSFKENYIVVHSGLEHPDADFSADVTSGNAPLFVQYSDNSTGNATAWSWNFGDGSVSSLQNPSHTYLIPGNYSVTLSASNQAGSDNETKTNYIQVYPFVPPPELPVANFIAEPLQGPIPLEVTFHDTSTGNPTAWFWDFGDQKNSTIQDPVHTYSFPGSYTIRLTVGNSAGSHTMVREGYIYAYHVTTPPPPSANFTAIPSSGVVPLTVAFHDTSLGVVTRRLWEFGDIPGDSPTIPGDFPTSDLHDPVHTYHQIGNFTVRLTVGNDGGNTTKENYILVFAPPVYLTPVANFTASPTSGVMPLTVSFNDTSLGNPVDWFWRFGDGGYSYEHHPVHTYLSDGLYTVNLTATNQYGSDIESKSNFILVIPITPVPTPPPDSEIPDADFTGSPRAGIAPLVVNFTDLSTGYPTSWSWDFGDGASSTSPYVSHTYVNAGTYTVTLVAWNEAGVDNETKPDYIHVSSPSEPPAVNFTAFPLSGQVPLTVSFNDTSTGNPTIWDWSFSDGTQSADQHPVHTYPSPGAYHVTLNAGNGSWFGQVTKYNYIGVLPAQPLHLDLSASPRSGPAPLPVTFTYAFTENATSWSWSFGDGTNSTASNPVHTYSTPGIYTIDLTVGTSWGTYVHITEPAYITVNSGETGTGITLSEGWNFISVPLRLAPGHNTALVFNGVDTAGHGIWRYDGFSRSWIQLTSVSPVGPLDGIWIYSQGTGFVPLQYAEDPISTPPLKQLAKGWNAIGVSGATDGTARDILLSVRGSWTQAIGFDEGTQQYETAVVNGGSGVLSDSRYLAPTNGYWLYMRDPGELAGLGV